LDVKSFTCKFEFANLLCGCMGLGDCIDTRLARYWIDSVVVTDPITPISLHPSPLV